MLQPRYYVTDIPGSRPTSHPTPTPILLQPRLRRALTYRLLAIQAASPAIFRRKHAQSSGHPTMSAQTAASAHTRPLVSVPRTPNVQLLDGQPVHSPLVQSVLFTSQSRPLVTDSAEITAPSPDLATRPRRVQSPPLRPTARLSLPGPRTSHSQTWRPWTNAAPLPELPCPTSSSRCLHLRSAACAAAS